MRFARIAALLLTIVLVYAFSAAVPAQQPAKEDAAPPALREKLAAEEISLVEEVVAARTIYVNNLKRLVAFYERTGDKTKLKEAQEELAATEKAAQSNYIIVAESLGPDIKPMKNIPEAEAIYKEAREADSDPAARAENKQKALSLYLSLISRYPESNRVAEAAWHSAVIYQHSLRDYHRAVVYYEKTYEWDPLTTHPARIQAARVAYTYLPDKARAKKLYEVAAKDSTSAAYRAEARAMVTALKNMGY